MDWGRRTPADPGFAPIEAFNDSLPCSLVFVILLITVRKVPVKEAKGFYLALWWWGWVKEIDEWPLHLKR